MKKLVAKYLNLGIKGNPEPSLVIRIRLLNVLNLSCLITSLIYAWINSSVHPIATLINIISVLVNMSIFGLILSQKYITSFFTFLILTTFIGISFAILFGKYLAADLLFCTGIAYAIAMFENKFRIFIGVTINLLCYILAMYFYENYLPYFNEAGDSIKQFYYPNAALFLVTLFVLVYLLKNENQRFEKTLQEKNKLLGILNQKNEELVKNILPQQVAKELKETGKVEPRVYKNATVMFTDFFHFTQIAEKMSAIELVEELDACFTIFDRITSKYEIEKLKTIGDAYMCVAGIPESKADDALNMIKAALEIREALGVYNIDRLGKGKAPWRIRIGIHSGSVVAGIIGETKFAFDIWGDTVNIASRMESHGEPDKINISSGTYKLVKSHINVIPRGHMHVKGKGEIDMYFVEDLK